MMMENTLKGVTGDWIFQRESLYFAESEAEKNIQFKTLDKIKTLLGIFFARPFEDANFTNACDCTLLIDNQKILNNTPSYLLETNPYLAFQKVMFPINKVLNTPIPVQLYGKRENPTKILRLELFLLGTNQL